MREQITREVLWIYTDGDGTTGRLQTADYSTAVLWELGVDGEEMRVDRDAARGLRDALNRLLGDRQGGAAEALHIAQHQQLEAAARWSARHVDHQAGMLARLADVLDPSDEADPSALLGTMHVILDVQRRTVASLGDLLAALAGQP